MYNYGKFWKDDTIYNSKKVKYSEKLDRIYIAYGSNLNIKQMQQRCPGVKIHSKSELKDYKLVYRYSSSGAYATIIRSAGSYVPVVLYKISEKHEHILDQYEGCPVYYEKKEIFVKLGNNQVVEGITYIMPDSAELGKPKTEYLEKIKEGYKYHNLNINVFLASIEENLREIENDYLKYIKTVKQESREFVLGMMKKA